MDGVPVKISEKYKPPPKVSIPQTITNRLNSGGYPPEIFTYNFTLEKNVIKHIEELKRLRGIAKANRHSRFQQSKLEHARELEEEQKKLLTNVSYPNADEISSGDEDESNSSTVAANSNVSATIPINNSKSPEIINQAFNQQNFNTILIPTVLPENNSNNLSHNPTLWKSCLNSNLKSNLGDKINYSDFENDTSSPFDNVELKTINDLAILAQVYNIPHSNNPENLTQQYDYSRNIQNTTNQIIHNQNKNTNVENLKIENRNHSPTIQNDNISTSYWKNNNSNPIVMQSTQNYEVPNTSVNHYYQQVQQNFTNMNNSLPNQQQYLIKADNYYGGGYSNVPINQNYQYNNFIPNNTDDNQSNSINYTNYINYNNQSNYSTYSRTNFQPPTVTCNSPTPTIPYANLNQYGTTNIDQRTIRSNIPNNIPSINNLSINESAIQSIKNRSKSVPDILKELNDEVRDAENRRTRNHSQTLEDHSGKCKEKIEKKINKLPASVLKLSLSSQNLIKNISSMGFPIERVAKIAEKLGTDDKKIIEHLIPLSELLDLGFDEERISEALLKFDNNKDKALDDLIS